MKELGKMELSLPIVGSSSVKEPGSYVCKLDQKSIVALTDRQDTGNNPNLAAKDGDFMPPWSDETPQLFARFTTKDGQTISDRFQLKGYEHYDPQNKASKEQKAEWTKAFKAEGITVAKFVQIAHRGSNYICAITSDGETLRVPSVENTNKSLLRLASMLKQIGFNGEVNTVEDLVSGLSTATELKEIVINVDEKVYDGERRSTSRLFKISYGQRKEKVALLAAISEEI